MPDAMFAILVFFVLGAVGMLGITILLRPSTFFRWFPNPMMPDTPLSQLQIRPVGLIFLLFIVLVLSSGSKSAIIEDFHKNILIALYAMLFISPIICLVLWRFGRGKYDRWDHRITLTFASIFLLTIITALLLAISGNHVY